MNPIAPVDVAPAPPAWKSLRAKGFVATMVLLIYVLGSVVYVSLERNKIYESIEGLQQLSRHEKALALAEAAVSGAVIDVSEASSAGEPALALPSEITLYMESCAKLFEALDEFDPRYALLQRAIARSYSNLLSAPLRANWIDLREALKRAADELEIKHRGLAERRDELTLSYQRHYDAVTVESLLLSMVGTAVFGALVAWFFARLTGDIRKLELHSRQIVHGSRGVVLPVKREDELGSLIHAVNRMSADLDEREKQIELDRQRNSHQDKMMALGALAAGLAHEVNNPLAVISGLAQELSVPDGALAPTQVTESARLILAQTERASQASRNLAELAAPQPTERNWVDVNAMARRALQLMGYDKRYRHIVFESDLAIDVPAVLTQGSAIQQLMMQLMSLGCDATVAAPRRPATVRVLTRSVDKQVEVQMEFPVALDFSQPGVQRVLLLSRAMIESLRGRLALGQDDPPLLRIKLAWPADPGSG
jgi:two-component system, NtrC family, sensor kinase